MAKPLGPKSVLIRDALSAHPRTGNTALAALINGSDARREDKIAVKPGDVAQQRKALKKARGGAKAAAAAAPNGAAGGPKPKGRPGRKPGQKGGRPTARALPVPAQAPGGDLIDDAGVIKALVAKLGADQVRRLVGLFG